MRCPGPGLSVMCHRCPSGTRAWGCPQQLVAPPRQMWDRGLTPPWAAAQEGRSRQCRVLQSHPHMPVAPVRVTAPPASPSQLT